MSSILLLGLFLVFAIFCVEGFDGTFRIKQGNLAKRGQFPHQVALLNPIIFKCGGSLIDSTTIVTAAHCFKDDKDASRWRVIAGDTDLRRIAYSSRVIIKADNSHIYNITKITVHPGYKRGESWSSGNDIAILKIDRRIDPMIPARPVALPMDKDDNSPDDTLCVASGYGATGGAWDKANGRYLYYTQVMTADSSVCYYAYKMKYPIRANNVCILGSPGNICSGDSGGGIICPHGDQQVLEGIVSWAATCSQAVDAPSVLTRVSHFLDWIEENRA
ncbi:serine protease 1-like [Lineus longissimus]|uniref:serine protease 1-like n=1 Tax=Lineus longissimus TaxID=88925 RepID=UPI002B4D6095